MKAEILFPKYSSPSGTAEVGGGGKGEEAKRDPRIESRATPGERQNRSLAAPRRPGGARGSARRCLSPALGKAGPPTARGRAAVPAGAGSGASPAGPRGPPQCSCAGRAYVCMRVCACAWCVRVRTPPPGPRAPVCSAPQSLAPAPFPPRPRLAAARASPAPAARMENLPSNRGGGRG